MTRSNDTALGLAICWAELIYGEDVAVRGDGRVVELLTWDQDEGLWVSNGRVDRGKVIASDA